MKAIVSYIWILLIFIGIMFVVSIEYGITMLQVFVFGAIFSFVWKYFTKNSIVVAVSFSHAEIDKGGKITSKIKIANQSFLPTSFVDIHWICPPQCEIEGSPVIRVTLAAKQTQEISFEYLAKIRGVAQIGVQKVILKSYFGWSNTLVVGEEEAKKLQTEVVVMPKIFHVDLSNELFMTQVSSEGEGQDDENSKASFFGGQPGYDFRDYRPGDALSKVNWKLSAKKDSLMVRENVDYFSNNKLLCLSPYAKESLFIQERLLESILSIVHALISNDIPVQIVYYEKGEWLLHKIENMTEFDALKVRLAQYEFRVSNQDSPTIKSINLDFHDTVRETLNIFLFSSTIEDYCYTMLSKSEKQNKQIYQIIAGDGENIGLTNSFENPVWIINKQNEIHRIPM